MQDEMLPPEQMRQLYNSISSSGNATWAEFPQAGHMDAYETQPLVSWYAAGRALRQSTLLPGCAQQGMLQSGVAAMHVDCVLPAYMCLRQPATLTPCSSLTSAVHGSLPAPTFLCLDAGVLASHKAVC